MREFIKKLVEILVSESEINMDTVLEDIIEWDSLSMVSFAATADIDYGKKLLAKDIKKAKTVQDLYNMVDDEYIQIKQ